MAPSSSHPLLKDNNKITYSESNSAAESTPKAKRGRNDDDFTTPRRNNLDEYAGRFLSSRLAYSSSKAKPLPLKQRTSSIDTRRDYTVQTWYSVLALLKVREYFITVDHFSIWRRHLAWAKEDGKDLRDYMTQRYASSMVFMSLLLSTELNVLFNSCSVSTDMRAQLYEENHGNIRFWIGITIITSIVLTLLSLLSTFTAWAMVSAVEKNNAHCIFRSSIGQFAAELPGRFIVFSVYSFLVWVIMFLFVLLPLGTYSMILLIVTVCLFFKVITAFSAFGRVIMHTGAMGSNRIFEPTYERRLLPHSLHSQLLQKARTNLTNKTSIIRQYGKAKSQKPIDNQFQYSTNPLFSCTDDDISSAQLSYQTIMTDQSSYYSHDRSISSDAVSNNSSFTSGRNSTNYEALHQQERKQQNQDFSCRSKRSHERNIHGNDAAARDHHHHYRRHQQSVKERTTPPRPKHVRGDSLVRFADTVDVDHSDIDKPKHTRGDSFVRFADTVFVDQSDHSKNTSTYSRSEHQSLSQSYHGPPSPHQQQPCHDQAKTISSKPSSMPPRSALQRSSSNNSATTTSSAKKINNPSPPILKKQLQRSMQAPRADFVSAYHAGTNIIGRNSSINSITSVTSNRSDHGISGQDGRHHNKSNNNVNNLPDENMMKKWLAQQSSFSTSTDTVATSTSSTQSSPPSSSMWPPVPLPIQTGAKQSISSSVSLQDQPASRLQSFSSSSLPLCDNGPNNVCPMSSSLSSSPSSSTRSTTPSPPTIETSIDDLEKGMNNLEPRARNSSCRSKSTHEPLFSKSVSVEKFAKNFTSDDNHHSNISHVVSTEK